MKPKSELPYVQSSTRFDNDPAAQMKSANLAMLTINERRSMGLSLEDLARRILPRLNIKSLETILSLGRSILTSKYATRKKYEGKNLTDWSVTQ